MKKRMISLALALMMCFSLSVTAFAEGEDMTLSYLANELIITSTTFAEDNVTTTYENLHDFADSARVYFPKLTEYELAVFIMQYTQQEYENAPNEVILDILNYDNITTSVSYIAITENGESFTSNCDAIPYATWTSLDGYMKLVTNYSHVSTSGNDKHYTVWCTATWLKAPAVYMQDALAITTSGEFDDSYSENGYVLQKSTCPTCGKSFTNNRSVTDSSPEDDDLEIIYSNFVPYIRFDSGLPSCTCGVNTTFTSCSAYLRYGMIASSTVTIQAAYGHKTLGLGDISASIDPDSISFSSNLVNITCTEYSARGVTVTY